MILRIRGEVQGVSFRETTVKEAQRLSLVGFVRNMKDGSVEVVAEGGEEELNELYEFCEVGPDLAVVDHVEDTWEHIKDYSYSDFKIKY